MADEIMIAPPTLCRYTNVQLAHEMMRHHLSCRISRCVWKAAAHHTLVLAGRLAPQSRSPRERAAARGIDFPPLHTGLPSNASIPAPEMLREVLDKLTELVHLPQTDRTMGPSAETRPHCVQGMSVQHTEVDGWLAVWELYRHEIRMTLVRNTLDNSEPLVACAPATAPDLVEMRDRYPKLARLWDQVHDDFWNAYRRPPRSRSMSQTYDDPAG